MWWAMKFFTAAKRGLKNNGMVLCARFPTLADSPFHGDWYAHCLGILAANVIGAWHFMGGQTGILQMLNNGFGALSSFNLVPIPLFLLMGELFFRTGLGMKMFNAVDQLMGKLPGRLSYVTVVGGTAFSTLSGSSMGSTALMGSLLVPEMERRGYKKKMAIGPILGTGGLAIIIPPSALAVLLATLAKVDIGALLIAGILPGLTLAGFYIATIFIRPSWIRRPRQSMS